MSDDPLDDIDPDDYEDREGDPFESLGVPAEDGDPDGTLDEDTADAEGSEPAAVDDATSDPFEYLGDESTEHSRATDPEDPGDPTEGDESPVDVAADPFGDVDVSRGDPFESAENPFERVDVDGVDPDNLWAELTADESDRADPADAPDDDVVQVSKHRFCEGCPHFSPPPDVTCTHETATILAFVGPDEVKIRNCPVVQERRELGEVYERE